MAGRFLVRLSFFLLAATPFTERLWTFDRFLHGGQDFEFSLLALILFFCLVILLARYAQHGLSAVLAIRRWLSIVFQRGTQADLYFSRRFPMILSSQRRQELIYSTPTIPLRV